MKGWVKQYSDSKCWCDRWRLRYLCDPSKFVQIWRNFDPRSGGDISRRNNITLSWAIFWSIRYLGLFLTITTCPKSDILFWLCTFPKRSRNSWPDLYLNLSDCRFFHHFIRLELWLCHLKEETCIRHLSSDRYSWRPPCRLALVFI